MTNLTPEKMVDHPGPVYLVRCTCGGIVPLSFTDKAVCEECGVVFPTWRGHLAGRTRTKEA